MKILIVDDDGLMLDVMSITLGELGHEDVRSAATGAQALACLDAELPQVVFCDLQMPGMDGVEFIGHLARRQFAGGVVLFSVEDWRILKTCEELGLAYGLHMLGTLQKPFLAEEVAPLLARVRVQPPPSGHRQEPVAPLELHEALRAGQIRAWFQPQLHAGTQAVVSAEALARWEHPERGLIPPMAFIAVAEEHGFIDAVLAAVYQDAMAQLGRWHRQGLALRVAVNLSVDNMTRRDLPEQIERWSAEAGVAPQSIMIEVTESRISTNMALVMEILARLRLKGFGLSIDDFGTGYSTLEQLHRMPFSELKVDRGFVHGAHADSRSRAVFESSVTLAHKLGMMSVAEGVETREDFELARALGAHLVQGYYFSKPLPPAEFEAWMLARGGQRAGVAQV